MRKKQRLNEKLSRYLPSKDESEIKKSIIRKVLSKDIPNTRLVYDVIKNDYLQGLKLLDKMGVDLRFDEEAPLIFACKKGYLDIVKYLIEKKNADVNARLDEPLTVAAANGHLSVVKYLVESGADISAGSYFAIDLAEQNNHFGVVEYLCNISGLNC